MDCVGKKWTHNWLNARKAARAKETLSIGNSVYSITFDSKDMLDKPPPFGAKYDFFLEDSVDCPEYLVHFDVFTK